MKIDRYKLLLLCVTWVMSTMCLMKFSLGFEPIDNYLLDCGSTKNTSVGKRVFLADTSDHGFLSNPDQESVKSADSVRILAPYGSELYMTARIVNTTSNYTFTVNQHGRHFVRLYFFPFGLDVGKRNLSSARFSVSAQGFTLLRDFQPDFTPVVKEYSLNVSSDKLVITFVPSGKSFAFLNAIEVVSQPDELIPPSAQTVEVTGNHSLMTHALETVARVNMGNQTVSPENDTLYRLWNADGPFIKHNSYVLFVSNLNAVNYTEGGPTRDIAPLSVYGTVTRLDTSSNPVLLLNNTWSFNVDPEFSYLVRFHFCNIIKLRPSEELIFNIYLNSLFVAKELNLGEHVPNIYGSPYFLDAVTRVSGNGLLNVSVGTSISKGNLPESILNGLEIMKISNSKGNLDEGETGTKSLTSRSKQKVWVIAASVGGALLVLALLGCVFFIVSRRNRRKSSQEYMSSNGNKNLDESTIFSRSKIGYRFPLIAIQEATDKFSESLVIGVGGFGKVYKGKLFDDTIVAVKRGAPQSHQGLAEFKTEIEMLSQLRHRHLVSLIGYCDEHNEMIIIYEYMENGTLKDHLYGSDLPKVNWKQRLEICIGSARGLHYLHTSSSKAIIHRDVKSANILLDENLMAKVADFGLSKDGPGLNQSHVSTAVKGSFGYLDPEYMTRQQLTEKSDVYSFGVVMYEILSGKPVIDPSRGQGMVSLVEWVKECREKGELEKVFDPFLVGKMKMESLKKFVEVADQCLAEEGVDRPTMGDVRFNLERALEFHLEGTQVKTPQMDTISETNHAENGVSSTLFSEASVGDLEGVSMSRVFSEMVKGEKPEMR